MTIARNVRLLAETLDQQGKADVPIAVVSTRRTLRPEFPPEKRGGPLRVGQHEIVCVPRTFGDAPQNLDWVGADEL